MKEQYREARRTDLVNEVNVTVGVAVVPVLAANPARRAIIISNASSTRVSFSNNPNMIAGQGVTLNGNVNPLVLERCVVAPWIVGPIYAIAAAAGNSVCIIEIIDHDYMG